jgi:hypothetical protein
MVKAVSDRIARDRGVAGFFAFIASLPPTAAALGMLYVGYRVITDPEDMSESNVWVVLAIIALFAFLFWIVARWTYDAVQAGLTPQRVQAMWLRRFQSESGSAFRTSRVIDRLSRHGVAALTLQDRDVQLSFEQRRNRLAPMFWLLFIPLSLAIAYFVWQGWQSAQADIMDLPPAQDLQTGIGQVFGAFLALIVVGILMMAGLILAVLATVLVVMLAAALVGPIGAMLSRGRDDFKSLPRLLDRIRRGKGGRGAAIVRISDAHWRQAVCSSLATVDVAIIDVSDVSAHVAWEIGEAVKACGAAALVFIRREDAEFGAQAKAAVQAALGRAPRQIITYPKSRSGDAGRFARQLRQHIYEAADMRHALKV